MSLDYVITTLILLDKVNVAMRLISYMTATSKLRKYLYVALMSLDSVITTLILLDKIHVEIRLIGYVIATS